MGFAEAPQSPQHPQRHPQHQRRTGSGDLTTASNSPLEPMTNRWQLRMNEKKYEKNKKSVEIPWWKHGESRWFDDANAKWLNLKIFFQGPNDPNAAQVEDIRAFLRFGVTRWIKSSSRCSTFNWRNWRNSLNWLFRVKVPTNHRCAPLPFTCSPATAPHCANCTSGARTAGTDEKVSPSGFWTRRNPSVTCRRVDMSVTLTLRPPVDMKTWRVRRNQGLHVERTCVQDIHQMLHELKYDGKMIENPLLYVDHWIDYCWVSLEAPIELAPSDVSLRPLRGLQVSLHGGCRVVAGRNLRSTDSGIPRGICRISAQCFAQGLLLEGLGGPDAFNFFGEDDLTRLRWLPSFSCADLVGWSPLVLLYSPLWHILKHGIKYH